MRVAVSIAFLLWVAIMLSAASAGVHGLGLAFMAVAASLPGGLLVCVAGLLRCIAEALDAWADDDAERPPG